MLTTTNSIIAKLLTFLTLITLFTPINAIKSTHWRITLYETDDCKGDEIGNWESDNNMDFQKFDNLITNAGSFGWDKGNEVEAHLGYCYTLIYSVSKESQCTKIDSSNCGGLGNITTCSNHGCGSNALAKGNTFMIIQ